MTGTPTDGGSSRRAVAADHALPIWKFGQIRLGQQLPEVNVVVTFVILLTVVPVFRWRSPPA